MSGRQPDVSVIIPTHDRVQMLMRTIRALERQTYDLDRIELVVVADGCTDGTATELREYAAACAIRVVEQDGEGPGGARNGGARHARGRLFVFLDDDVEPEPGLIEAHVRAHDGRARIAVMGPYPPSLEGRASFFRMQTRGWWESVFAEMSRPGHRFRYSDLITGNLSLSSELFRELRGFDVSVGKAHEDYELGIRLIKAQVQFVFLPEARAWHHEHETMTMAGAFSRAKNEGHANVTIGRLHPELRYEIFSALDEANDTRYRHLRALTFRRPRVGRALAWCGMRLLTVLELLKMRHRWRRLFGALFAYWYWRGVADEMGDEAALGRYLENAPPAHDSSDQELVIDLGEGLERAERRLDAERPSSLRLRFDNVALGRVEPMLLAEPLRGVHLRPILAERFSWQILHALVRRETAFAGIESDGSVES